MLEFAKFQQNALSLSDKLMRRFVSSLGCCSFFYTNSINDERIQDCLLISLVAKSLHKDNDSVLLEYLRSNFLNARVTQRDLAEFKQKTLAGIYILVWSRYSSTISTYLNQSMIELFQRDLEVLSLNDMNSQLSDESLYALSQYCSFAYENQQIKIYSDLMRHLGESIQVDIYTLRSSKQESSSSFYDVYLGVKRTLGLNFLF
ncbi:hypothetical protein [Legionella waltersii]|uniref:Uncharacterized protein n=1 Tax=Legionella waltersii TaxID=66969 RepID=A0A0W1AAW7_9GAMM|nr:hypothetical protein [Legionella waltersii]KTD78420.1 hypothetical protein Lwal_1855 [Legionella waltersii]SNV06142.1 Uncharacterised protein [Legionella waltersii]